MSDAQNIMLCFGTRPEAIKMAPVIHELKKREVGVQICVTAQHREMLDQVLEFFEITPEIDLDLMKQGQDLNGLSSQIFRSIDAVFSREQPGLVLVHGDTTTSVIVAMAAFHKGIQVGHVEAGLRTFNRKSPFPEEINRQLTARLASFQFAPTMAARQNLIKENISKETITITGNTAVDAVEWGKRKIEDISTEMVSREIGVKESALKHYVLVTGHRRENFGEGLSNICKALKELSQDVQIIFPVHLNPNVQHEVFLRLSRIDNVHLINPVSYPLMLWLMKHCEFIISDSGGIQEEAPSFGKKVLVTRAVSERMEAVEVGTSILVGTDANKILAESRKLLNVAAVKSVRNPFGDGQAAKRIVETLLKKTNNSIA